MAIVIKNRILLQQNPDSVADNKKRFTGKDYNIVENGTDISNMIDALTPVVVDDSDVAKQELSDSDSKMARIGESVIKQLVDAKLIDLTKLDPAEQKLLADREAMRARL